MVARISASKSLSKVLNYNEHKVKEKQAEALAAHNFLKDGDKLNFHDKKSHFERLTSLNERTKTNVLHVSLNFDSSEKIDNDKMREIAKAYMEKIGFGDQPYLVYRHNDSGHPHMHIVSTNIRADGSRISMHNLGRNASEKARKEVEVEFGLVKAQEKKFDERIKLTPVSAQKVAMGRIATKRAINNVLAAVVNQYKFASLEELNAVLKLYNVFAEKGEHGSVMYEKGGLVFRVINEKGAKISPPIKASTFWMKPTLKNLEKKFLENERLKQLHARKLKTTLDYAFLKYKNKSLDSLIGILQKENISVILRQNKQGLIYGITYVDHRSKTVFNGSDLGKVYSAKMVLESTGVANNKVSMAGEKAKTSSVSDELQDQAIQPRISDSMQLKILPEPMNLNAFVPGQLKRRKRKRKQKRLRL
jgi:hypothetical protein